MSNKIKCVLQSDIVDDVTGQDVSVDDGKTFHKVWIIRLVCGAFGYCIPSLFIEGGSPDTPEGALALAMKIILTGGAVLGSLLFT